MKSKKLNRVKTVYLFPNGNFAVFDVAGSQISELQGSYSIELHKRILLECRKDCEIKGLQILPQGFRDTVSSWVDHWEDKGLSWEEIQEQF